MLKVSQVHFSVKKKEILKDISFSIEPGEICAIVGSSGAGKSSLFHLLTGAYRPTLGQITLDETLIHQLGKKEMQRYRRNIGIIFQDFRLLPQKTVTENVAYALEVCGMEEHKSSRVPALLKLVGLLDKQDRFPHELSGGEKQRVAIARALVHTPKILIADEATGNLDPKNSREIAELFLHLHKLKGLTIIFSTHDPILVETMKPRVLKLDHGELIFDRKKCALEDAFSGLI